MDETGVPIGVADGDNPEGRRGWQWFVHKQVVTVFLQGLHRTTAAAMELLGAFAGTRFVEDCVYMVSDHFSATNHLPLEQRQLCWEHLIHDLTANAKRLGPNR